MSRLRISLTRRWAALVLVLCPLVSPPVPAQAPAEDIFVDRVEVQLVEVEVVVTDRQGRRVRGLDRDAFRLTVDGQPVPVQLFEEIYLPAPGEAPAPDGSEPAATVADGRAGRSLLLFVDDSWTDRRGRARALKNLQKELGNLGPEDEVAVVRYEAGLLDVVTEWTSDPAVLGAALKEVQKTVPGDLQRETVVAGHSDPRVRDRVIRGQIAKVANAAAVTMAGLADAKGRKLFVPISSGWPYDRFSTLDSSPTPLSTGPVLTVRAETDPESPIDSAVEPRSFAATLAERGDSSLDRDIHPVFAAANRLGYTIYPIHVGIEPSEVSRGSLRIVAVETGGGMLAEGAANATPLTDALEDTRAYYVLAFDTGELAEGVTREIDVTVDRPGLRARHRKSILALTARERASLVADRALLLGAGNGDLDFEVGQEIRGRRVVQVPVTLTIPMDWATVLPVAGGGVAAQLELRVAALDERGDRSDTQVIALDVAGPAPPAPGSHATYELAVEIRPNTRRMVLVLHDKLTGESLSGSYERDV